MTRAREILAAILLVLATLSPALAARAPETLADPVQEARARALQREFRCPVCQGQSLDDSNAPLAADLRHLIRERIVAGDSDAKIEQFLASRYGNFILMRPPFEISTYFLWLMPLLVLISGAAVATFVVVRAQKRPD